VNEFNEKLLAKSLAIVSSRQQLAFAASCCERMIDNYSAFTALENWGNPVLVQQGLDEIWKFLGGQDISFEYARQLINSIEKVIPDSDDFSNLFTFSAQNAANSICYSLESLEDANPEKIAIVGRLCIEALESYLYWITDTDTQVHMTDPKLDEWIAHAPLLYAELQKQQKDLELISSHPELSATFLESLRSSSHNIGIQPFARGFIKIKK
jgi:uncharacterized protein YjaG (DUF416 family)